MSAVEQPEPFVDADAVAAFLCVKRRQALEMARRGVIPSHPLKAQGKGTRQTWRFRLTEVSDAIAGGSEKSAQSRIVSAASMSQRRNSNG
jgi:hypothetical protein